MSRGSGLQRTGTLIAGQPLQRGTQLAYRSKKTAARYVPRRALVAELFAEPEICEVPWCTLIATDPHEALTRARGGDILDRSIIRKVCHPHNVMFASDEQPWMYELGFLIHSWDGAA
jgi:hypothetical protein